MSKREYGTGSVYYIEARKKWAAQYRVGYNADGKPKKKTVFGDTKKEVKDKLKKLQAEVVTGSYAEPSRLTVVDIAKSINDNKKALNIVGENAYIRNVNTISIIEKHTIGNIPVQKLSEPILTSFLSSQTSYSNSVIKKIYSTLNSAFKKAVKMNIIKSNPLDDVIRPNSTKQTKKVRALTIDEEKAVIEAVNTDRKEPYRTMILLSLFTGMRMGEVSALQTTDLLLNNTIINVSRTMTKDEHDHAILGTTTKTYAGLRNLKLSKPIQKMLSQYLKEHFRDNEYNLLFLAKNGSMITTNQVNCYYKRLIERYGIAPADECNQHQLRHTYATRCIESGMPAKILQHQLGHTDISTTLNTYCDVFDSYSDKYLDKTQEYFAQQNIAI